MRVKSQLSQKRNWIIGGGILVLVICVFWTIRPLSWRTYDKERVVPTEIGLVWSSPDSLSFPDWVHQDDWVVQYHEMMQWWTAQLGITKPTTDQLLLLQKTGPASISACLVVELGTQRKPWETWLAEQVSDQIPQTQFRGFSIYQFEAEGRSIYCLTYANLLIMSPLALLVESCLAQLENHDASWLASSQLWQSDKTALYFTAQGCRELVPHLAQTELFPWWSFIADQIVEARLAVSVKKWDELSFKTQSAFPQQPLQSNAFTDSLCQLIPTQTKAWIASGMEDGTALLQLILAGEHKTEVERVWLGTSDLLRPNEQKLLLGQKEYFSFTLQEWKQIELPELLGNWPATQSIWTTSMGEISIVANRLSALERWIDAFVVGAMGSESLMTKDAPLELVLQLDALPPLLQHWPKGQQKIHLSLYPTKNDVWQVKSHMLSDESVAEERRPDSRLAWQYEMEAELWAAPRAVKNIKNEAVGEVAVQDQKGRLIVLDVAGSVIWEKQLAQPLRSAMWKLQNTQTDRPQYVFSTSTQWGVVDKQGEWLSGFPINLPGPAQIGMQLVDFDRNARSWYVFIPITGKKVYGYKWTGEVLPAWNPHWIAAEIQNPVQHLQSAYKDYLLLVNQNQQVTVLGRDAEERFVPIQFDTTLCSPLFYQADATAVRMVILDKAGRAQVIDTSGQHFPLLLREADKSPECFSFADFTADSRYDYAMGAERAVWVKAYREDKFATAYTLQVPHRVDTLFAVARAASDGKALLGVIDRERKVFSLWQGTDLLRPDMPLAGETPVQRIRKGRFVTAFHNAVYAYDLNER